ncbi:antibiotic biosynthesis monooxygenase family protein [Propionibacteriaceae bacterium Y1700]|uniref:antibiotic biosynthesis monooxygenase family protein n=1 Tax=Microlunatus sp. Y1700 TaxID=3418487 RepID=UPI003DA6F998
MTTIDTDKDVITLINIFTVEPERCDELVEVLDRATVEVMRHRPGFVSANIHVGLARDRVANYAQWASEQDFRAMLADPVCQEHMGVAASMAAAEPQLYRVHSVHGRVPE